MNKIKKLIKNFLQFIKNNRQKKFIFVKNLNYDPTLKSQKSVLISYLTSPLQTPHDLLIKSIRANKVAAIIKCFFKKNYIVDLIDCRDDQNFKYLQSKQYDVIFGLGEPFYIACKYNKNAKKIIYNSELHPDYSKTKLKERLTYYKERHGYLPESRRSYRYYKQHHFDNIDIGILQGNSFTSQAYDNKLKTIYLLKCAGLINTDYKRCNRKYASSKKNFIWFGSKGAIHKGLDLCVDVFTNLPNHKLYICGLKKIDKQYINTNPSNIIDMGFIDVQSSQFLKLVNKCSFVIFPSCSEGMPTSVLTCMNHGLIPLITRETGIDLKDFGKYIEDFKINKIKQVVLQVSEWNDNKIKNQHQKVYNYSKENFNIKSYTQNINTILTKILD